ncbi:NAD(P)H-binding protein [Gracilimonas sp. Q87]|uniref:NAD(P)H-binding protein n=1 Tax=Gracilimonas sp. Q87 TaxID=3384766 RepID=UPI0039844FDD
MKILIIGANGQIGTRLAHQLNDSEHDPVAMIRKEKQQEKFKKEGIPTVLADLEEDISHAFKDIEGVVFTAGSGADTPKSQTKVIDEEGAKKAIDEAIDAEVNRFVMVSALKANRDPKNWSDSMQHYYEAKSNADEYLRNSGLNYTVLMPGRLTNEEGTGRV